MRRAPWRACLRRQCCLLEGQGLFTGLAGDLRRHRRAMQRVHSGRAQRKGFAVEANSDLGRVAVLQRELPTLRIVRRGSITR